VEDPPATVPIHYGPFPLLPRIVLEENDRYVTWVDNWGITRRDYKLGESMPAFLDFPVKNRDDWERYKAERLDPHHPGRLATEWRTHCQEWTGRGIPIQLGCFPDVGIYGSVRWLLGDEECLLAFRLDPDLVHDIMEHVTTLYLTLFEQVAQEVRVDVVHVWEDMCGRQGPLISPADWREFMGPCYRRLRNFCDRHDIPLLSVDTDGQPDLIVPPMMETGVNYLWPLEVAAGCDANVYRERYPTLGLMGGIDKRALAAGPEAIDRELERIRPAMEKGRYIPELDHGIPHDVSWQNYCYYAGRLGQLVGAMEREA
jgi:uroporphyrinogen decarboxylase